MFVAILATGKFPGGVPLPTLRNLSIDWLAQGLIARAPVASPNEISRDIA